MKKVLLLISSVLLLSCNSDTETVLSDQTSILSNEENHLCYTIDPIDSLKNLTGRVSYKGYYWSNGQTIKIKFLNGDAFLQNKVKQFASQWLDFANLKFVWVASDQNADVKIGFKWNGDQGSWSHIGKNSSNIASNQPSMNFGWFSSATADEEFSRVVIHEFGHALGLGHEHQNPTSPIQWNKEVVYNEYAKQGWSRATVDSNILNKFLISQVDYTNFDNKSIMLYSFPSSFTLNGYSAPWNTNLSNEDMVSIRSIYPYPTSSTDRNTLLANESLMVEQFIKSNNKRYVLIMQGDGNLVLYDERNGGVAIWYTDTYGKIGAAVWMQADGNFVMYQNGKALWNTNTSNSFGAIITLQDDGNLVIYLKGKALWSSKGGKIN